MLTAFQVVWCQAPALLAKGKVLKIAIRHTKDLYVKVLVGSGAGLRQSDHLGVGAGFNFEAGNPCLAGFPEGGCAAAVGNPAGVTILLQSGGDG